MVTDIFCWTGLKLHQSRCHLSHGVYSRDGVEMDGPYTVGIEVATLLGCPFDAQLAHLIIILAFNHLCGQRVRQVAMKSLGHHSKLRLLGDGFDARNDGDGNTHLRAPRSRNISGCQRTSV